MSNKHRGDPTWGLNHLQREPRLSIGRLPLPASQELRAMRSLRYEARYSAKRTQCQMPYPIHHCLYLIFCDVSRGSEGAEGYRNADKAGRSPQSKKASAKLHMSDGTLSVRGITIIASATAARIDCPMDDTMSIGYHGKG